MGVVSSGVVCVCRVEGTSGAGWDGRRERRRGRGVNKNGAGRRRAHVGTNDEREGGSEVFCDE